MTDSLKDQVGGSHYKKLAIQPVEYIQKNGLGYIEGSVVKYVTRWRDKGGVEDLKKARHFLSMLIEMESTRVGTDNQDDVAFRREMAKYAQSDNQGTRDSTPKSYNPWFDRMMQERYKIRGIDLAPTRTLITQPGQMTVEEIKDHAKQVFGIDLGHVASDVYNHIAMGMESAFIAYSVANVKAKHLGRTHVFAINDRYYIGWENPSHGD